MMARAESNYCGFSSDSNIIPILYQGFTGSTQSDYMNGGQWSTPVSAVAPVLVYDRRIAQLEKEIRELREMITSMIQSKESDTPIIDLRDISVDQAKDEIARYFRENDGREIDIDELIEGLAIDPHTVVKACNILEMEGKIG
jgi:hypothetical protein